MKKGIAFFDFDGTITTKDTLLELIKFQKGSFLFYLGFLIHLPGLLAYKLGVISNQSAKQQILQFFFNKVPVASFQSKCDGFATDVLPRMLRPKALEEIKGYTQRGVPVVIVSASAENWIRKWSDEQGITLIATQLEQKQERMTGRIVGRNCYGEEKRRRIQESYDLSQYDEIFCYGDSKGDHAMLALATHPFYKPFR